MEVRVELGDGCQIPKGTYVAVRFGDVQKQCRFDPDHLYKFPEKRRYGRVELLKKVGTVDLCLDPDSGEARVCRVDTDDPSYKDLRLKVRAGGAGASSTGKKGGLPTLQGADVAPKDKMAAQASANAKKYLEEHNVEEILTGAMRALVKERPQNPPEYLVDYIVRKNPNVKLPPLPPIQPSSVMPPKEPISPPPPGRPKSKGGSRPGSRPGRVHKPAATAAPTSPIAQSGFASYYMANIKPACQSAFWAQMNSKFGGRNVKASATVAVALTANGFSAYYQAHIQPACQPACFSKIHASFGRTRKAPTTLAVKAPAKQLGTGSFSNYYTMHIQPACQPSFFGKLQASFGVSRAKVKVPARGIGDSFTTYYTANIGPSCQPQCFAGIHAKFAGNQRAKAAISSKVVVPQRGTGDDFTAYYSTHVQPSCASGCWTSMHGKFGVRLTPKVPARRGSPGLAITAVESKPAAASREWECKPSIGTWLTPMPAAIKPPAPTWVKTPKPPQFMPSVATWLTPLPKKIHKEEEKAPAPFHMKPSVGTWIAYIPDEEPVNPAAKQAPEFLPSVGTWLAHLPKDDAGTGTEDACKSHVTAIEDRYSSGAKEMLEPAQQQTVDVLLTSLKEGQFKAALSMPHAPAFAFKP